MSTDDSNRNAICGLLADADRALAFLDRAEGRRNQGSTRETIATVRQNYIDLVRRRRPLAMADREGAIFQQTLDRLKARLQLLDESI
jgi:hypothetical protein